MAIIEKNLKPVINLSGPQGNAFYLLGIASRYAKELLFFSKEETTDLLNKMQSSDYEHLITVFDEHFGDYIDLER